MRFEEETRSHLKNSRFRDDPTVKSNVECVVGGDWNRGSIDFAQEG